MCPCVVAAHTMRKCYINGLRFFHDLAAILAMRHSGGGAAAAAATGGGAAEDELVRICVWNDCQR
jgi:hypothetical protein